jgi:hypothetical protein
MSSINRFTPYVYKGLKPANQLLKFGHTENCKPDDPNCPDTQAYKDLKAKLSDSRQSLKEQIERNKNKGKQ